MTKTQQKFQKSADQLDALTKPIRNLAWLGTLFIAAWVQFLGPGISDSLQKFLSIDVILQELSHQPPPKVVDWIESASHQDGICNSDQCDFILVGSRTEYGEDCGMPVTAPELVTNTGAVYQLSYKESWAPVELTRRPKAFPVELDMPRFVPSGEHQWRTRLIYPTCQGIKEPQERFTPYFPLTVSSIE